MAKVLKKQKVMPDLILSSTAVRAFEFAGIIADELNYKSKNIFASKDLYMADEDEMLEIVNNISDNYDIVFLVGHNPEITNFANSLCSCSLDNIPTSGIAAIKFRNMKWKEIAPGKGELESFDYPKKYPGDVI